MKYDPNKSKADLAARLEGIVHSIVMPDEWAVELLSSTVLFLTGQCDLKNFADAVAHTRLCIPEDYQDATTALAGWLDEANRIISYS